MSGKDNPSITWKPTGGSADMTKESTAIYQAGRTVVRGPLGADTMHPGPYSGLKALKRCRESSIVRSSQPE